MPPVIGGSLAGGVRRGTLRRVWLALSVVTLLAVLFPTAAHAWTQMRNEYTDTGQGSIGCGSEAYPCIEWAHNSQVLYWMGADLFRLPEGKPWSLAGYTKGAMEDNWNAVPFANQPLFTQVTNGSLSEVNFRMQDLDADTWGRMDPVLGGKTRGCPTGCWRAPLVGANVYFNYKTSWNNTGTYFRFADGQWTIDIRCVALHEGGHAEGLGHHTRPAEAVMYADCSESRHESLLYDDRNGLQRIYD